MLHAHYYNFFYFIASFHTGYSQTLRDEKIYSCGTRILQMGNCPMPSNISVKFIILVKAQIGPVVLSLSSVSFST